MSKRRIPAKTAQNPSNKRNSTSFGWLVNAAPAPTLERLEERVLLSTVGPVTLPESAYVNWGGANVAAERGQYIVTFDNIVGQERAVMLAREAATRLGVSATDFRAIGRGGYATFVTYDRVTLDSAVRVARQMPHVKGIEPDFLMFPERVPNDPRFTEQYGLRNTGQFIPGLGIGTIGADINVIDAWDITIGSRDTIIAIVDTGLDVTHPDLAPNVWVNPGEIPGNGIDDDGNGFVDDINGFNFGDLNGNLTDDEGHGTQVASVVGAVGNDGIGITGVAWAVSLMGLKVTSRIFPGALSTSAIVGANDYITMMRGRGVNIVASNNSYGAFIPAFFEDLPQAGFTAQRDSIQRLIDSGGIFIAAAGNNGSDNDQVFTSFPASFQVEGIIAVAATDNNDGLAGFSNYGAQKVDLGAPGVLILMAQAGGGYNFNSGTSMSSPMVAGAVALIKTHKPNASAVEVREALINSADPLPSLQGRTRAGGRLNVARALQVIGSAGPVLRTLEPGPVFGQLIGTTNQPNNTLTATFTKDLDDNPAFFNTSGVTVTGAGNDNAFGTADDIIVPIGSLVRNATNPRVAVITMNLSGFSQSRLPLGQYRLTLQPTAFRDQSGNLLNGNSVSGTPQNYNFRVVATTGDNEPNDQTTTATPVAFDASGTARFLGVTLGNGFFANLDVDLYRIDMPRGGQITAEITARRRAAGSTLDSVLRLFDANGVEITKNDQFFGQDSYFDFFVTTGGTYYVGVSGFGNDRYNPLIGGSGSSQSTGVYDIRMDVQLVTDDVITFTPGSGDTTLPRRIPVAANQTQGTTTASINIADSRQILDVNVLINIQHDFTPDLQISLISPAGTEVMLINRRGGTGTSFTNTLLDDEASVAIANGSGTFTGSFRPDGSSAGALGLFDGQSALGLWTLRIVDTTALNAGNLLNWSLTFTFQNNIFGPFEANDTLTTSKPLQEINGTGSATRNAFLGDGGFGVRDRDIFRFVADAGSSLTAVVTAAGQFNSALRLFDSQGNQITISNLLNSRDSRIENFVFTNGGTYYIAVSEGNNVAYNPSVTSDNASQPALTTGNYVLTVTLAAGVSDPAHVLTGSRVSVAVDTGGTFNGTGSADTSSRLRFAGVEFLPDDEGVFFGAVASGSSFTNAGPTRGNQLPFALTNRGDGANNSISARAQFNSLRVARNISYGVGDSFLAIDVVLTNTGSAAMTGVAWMEGFNPDPGVLILGSGSRNTSNDVDPTGRYAQAVFTNNTFQQGLTIALAAPSADTRARATVLTSTTVVRDPLQLIALPQSDPNGTSSDGQLALTFDIGSIGGGASARMRYFVFFGNSPAEAQALFARVNDGTGTGHLTATVTNNGGIISVGSANPGTEVLLTGGAPVTAPTLPYRQYYPEGFFGDNIYTFIPIENPNDQDTRVVVIARYETGIRDQFVGELTIPANSRSGLTLTTPEDFRAGRALAGRAGAGGVPTPYALEIRSERPVASTFSHYDLNLVSTPAAIGEAFTTRTNNAWSFGQVEKNSGINDYILWYNTTENDVTVSTSFYPSAGGAPFEVALGLTGLRRGGISVADVTITNDYTLGSDYTLPSNYTTNTVLTLPGGTGTIPAGTVLTAGTIVRSGTFMPSGSLLLPGLYGASVSTTTPIVASLSHYDANNRRAEGVTGNAGLGSTRAITPEGQFGVNATEEVIGVLNANNQSATITFSFVFTNGSAYRTSLIVPRRSYGSLDVSTLPNFPSGQPYGISYESDVPVSIRTPDNAFDDALSTSAADTAYTLWGFAEGFRPADNSGHPGVVEYLRLYNPGITDTTVEITIGFDGGLGSETFRRTLPARRVSEFNMDQFITGGRRAVFTYYGTTIKAASPIVAYMGHFDRFFPGAFGTLGTPLGLASPVA